MELSFTTSAEAELHEIIAIDPIAARVQTRRSQLQSWLRAGQCLSVRRADTLVAYAVVTQNFFYQTMLELLIVSPAEQRRGIGRQTLRHLLKSFEGPILWTSTNTSNTPMRSLLAELNFEFCGSITGLDEGDPEMIYRIAKVQD
jgi:ribosomal protein S18 acetylase RimI-like enzyme